MGIEWTDDDYVEGDQNILNERFSRQRGHNPPRARYRRHPHPGRTYRPYSHGPRPYFRGRWREDYPPYHRHG